MSITIIRPEYFDDFRCLGNNCNYDCCSNWGITMGKSDYSKIRSAHKSKELQELVESCFKRNKEETDEKKYASIAFDENGKCKMLDDAGLCRLQIECGAETLPSICKVFPRAIAYSFGEKISYCSTGCEEVVNLLLKLPDGIKFIEEQSDMNVTSKVLVEFVTARPIIKRFYSISKLCINILQNKSYLLENRFILLGIVLKSLQELEEAKEYDRFPDWLVEKQKLVNVPNLEETLKKLGAQSEMCTLNNVRLLNIMQHMSNYAFSKIHDDICKNLEIPIDGDLSYNRDKYAAAVSHLKTIAPEYIFENVMVNYVFGRSFPITEPTFWEDYALLCHAYSLLKFMVVGYMADKTEQADLVHIITVFSREFFQNSSIKEVTSKLSEATNSNTLAHLAIMVKG